MRHLIAELDNQGTIELSTSAAVFKNADGDCTNSGTIQVAPTDTLTLSMVYFDNQTAGSIEGGGLLVLDRADLAGTGTLAANVEAYESTLSPAGLGMGILRIDGSLYLDTFSELNVDIDGTIPGSGYDRLEVTDRAYLDGGYLNLRVKDSYQPTTCDLLTVLSYGSWNGIFEDIQKISPEGVLLGLGLAGGLRLKPRFDTQGLHLLVGPADTRINVAPTELNLAEGGASQSYRVCLGSRPDDQVRIAVSPDAQVRVSPTEVIFSEAAWGGVQSVVANAVDDAAVEGPHTGIITHSATSRDDDFDRTQVSRVVVQIADNEQGSSLSVGDVLVVEGNSDTKQAVFAVTLSPASTQTVTVAYATANGTATAGVGANGDYNAASGTLTYTAGQTSKTVGVTIRGDGTAEANETFSLNLSNPGNAILSDAQGIGTIINNDGPAKVVAKGLIGEGEFGIANYPNPFNPSTQIVYTLTEEAPVRLAVYNTLGQGIRVLVEGLQAPGSYEVQWDGRNEEGQQVSGGWYLYRLEAGEQVAVGRMSLVK